MIKGHLKLDIKSVEKVLNVTVMTLDKASKEAVTEACKKIYEESLKLVPRDTGTLASSAYYTVLGNFKTGFVGYIGYGGGMKYNRKSRAPASSYMIKIHEDVTLRHTNGQAKFLELPMRRFRGNASISVARSIGGELR